VTPAPPPVPDEYSRLKAMDLADLDRLGLLQDVHFDFDRADVREGDRAVLSNDADALKRFDFIRLTVEGHCDERGTVEYNLALGERRARAAHDYLVALGVPAERLKTVSYGKESPLCTEHDEACWQRNRRAHLRITGKAGGR
jgi:peptidoglycan-associated lipoprotein